jgi:hypothetical protein
LASVAKATAGRPLEPGKSGAIEQREGRDARQGGARPAAGVARAGRRIAGDVGRYREILVEQAGQLAAGDAQDEAAARGEADEAAPDIRFVDA